MQFLTRFDTWFMENVVEPRVWKLESLTKLNNFKWAAILAFVHPLLFLVSVLTMKEANLFALLIGQICLSNVMWLVAVAALRKIKPGHTNPLRLRWWYMRLFAWIIMLVILPTAVTINGYPLITNLFASVICLSVFVYIHIMSSNTMPAKLRSRSKVAVSPAV